VSHLDSAALASTDIWSLDFAQNSAVAKLTSKSATHDNRNPVWSPDGIQIAYASGQADGKGSALAKRSSNGSGAEDVVLPSNGKERHLNHWSRDGFLLFAEQGEKTKSDLWFVPVNGARTPEVFLHDDFNETEGQFSPDGHWVAYVSDETGQTQVYIQPFPQGAGDGGKIPVSSTQGSMPRWRRDGKELFFVQGATKVMAVDFTPTPTAKVGIPRELFQLVIGSASPQTFLWDVTPLGDRFLFSLPNIGSSNAPLTVLLNWQRMLEK
jgi:Tol biopolymer transport system component